MALRKLKNDPRLKRSETQVQTHRVSWRATFLSFNEMHSGHPVDFRGRLLYRDGWQHSSTDYKGPSYPPPRDMIERRNLKRYYWQIRRKALQLVLIALEEQISSLVEMQESTGVPPVVWTKTYMYNEELDKEVAKMEPLPIDWETVMNQREDIKADIRQCNEFIEKYKL